jgi:type IV pilus assembly protein PilE
MASTSKAGTRGFTLIEVMITVAIVGILTTIAMSMYSLQVQKSRRTDARTAVLDLAGREERFYSVSNNYSQTPSDLGYPGVFPQNVGSNFYSINVVVGVGPPPANAPTYVITATAINQQLNDTSCFSFSINQLGQQSSLDSGGGNSTATCWT